MFRLVLDQAGVVREFVLVEGVSRIGRAEDVEISIDDRSLSRAHAQLELKNGAVTVSDLGSKNGTSVNGRPVQGPTPLEPDGALRLGEVNLVLRCVSPTPASETIAPSAPAGSRTQTGTWTGVQVSQSDGPRARLVVASSPDAQAVGRSWDLDGQTLEIGRGQGGAAEIEDPRMSRRHLRVARLKGDDWAEDLGSANGTLVDGQPLQSAVRLTPGQILRVGTSLFVVDAPTSTTRLPARADVAGDEVTEVLGISLVASQLRRAIATAAGAQGAVLLLGETGVGKEIAARAIHRLSGRTGDLLPVNCATLSDTLGNDELFGHYEGAFTGADRDRDGMFVRATGGTLFLDEVGDLPSSVQARLLRVLQDGLVQPLGDGPAVETDARIVAATNSDLEAATFRRDLLARLQGWSLRLPPLRERKADIVPLWDHFVVEVLDRAPPPRAASFDEALLSYHWPQNIRELQKVAQRTAQLLPRGGRFTVDLLPDPIRACVSQHKEERGAAGRGSPSRERIERALRAAGGNVKNAAERNGWHRTQLYRWCERLGIDPARYRG